jgi:hypothetical protein
MGKEKRILIRFLIVFISVFLIDGGRCFLLTGNNIQLVIAHDHINDVEAPHQHHVVNFNDDERWLEPSRVNFLNFSYNTTKFLFTIDSDSQEFSDSIWQPPKFI